MNSPLPESEGAATQPVDIEDRTAPRFTLLIRPAKLHVGPAQYVCVIRDISATGLSARLFHEIAWKGAVVLELQTGDRYPAELVWHRGAEAGFQFLDQIDVDSVIGNCSLYPKRDLRFDVALPISIHARGQAITATVRNLSRQGALLESEASLAIDQAMMLEAQGLPVIEARVRWRKDRRIGVVFDTTFSLQQLAVTLERLQRPGKGAAGPAASADDTAAGRS